MKFSFSFDKLTKVLMRVVTLLIPLMLTPQEQIVSVYMLHLVLIGQAWVKFQVRRHSYATHSSKQEQTYLHVTSFANRSSITEVSTSARTVFGLLSIYNGWCGSCE